VKRRFRLFAVERLRAGTLADAARALGDARRELTAALGYRDRIKAELQQTSAAWRAAPAEQMSAEQRRVALREELALATDRCTAAQSQELAALAAWNTARSDLRAVEMLHERHRLALAEADARAEQQEIDEFAALSHRRSTDDPDTFDPDTFDPTQDGDDA
jgi:flagellar biosynthesis chaperone FliJ